MAYTKEQKRAWAKKKRHLRYNIAVGFLGDSCKKCGSVENLEFDHIEPKSKLDSLPALFTASEKVFWAEVLKCQVLCRDCHVIKSRAEGTMQPAATHGIWGMYQKHKCRCSICRGFNTVMNKKYKKNKM